MGKVKFKRNNWLVSLLRYVYHKYRFTNESFIKKYFKKHMGREVNLSAPRSFNDKIQWLKLYWFNPLAKQCADKFEVRDLIKKEVGDKYLNDVYEVYES